MKYTHQAPVISLANAKTHPNADTLSVVETPSLSTVVFKTESFNDGKAIWIQPQSLVDTHREEFSFLSTDSKRWKEIGTRKLRGVYSAGFLVPVPPDMVVEVGDDLSAYFGVQHADHESEGMKLGRDEKPFNSPLYGVNKYDVDGAAKMIRWFDNKTVNVTTKLHGSNIGVMWDGENVRVRSRSLWKKRGEGCDFWQGYDNLVRDFPHFVDILKEHPNHIFYGELYGLAKKGGVKFRYDADNDRVKIRFFDVMQPNRQFFCAKRMGEVIPADIRVPTLYEDVFDKEKIISLLSEPCPLGNLVMEGVVVKAEPNDFSPKGERLIMKFINPEYDSL